VVVDLPFDGPRLVGGGLTEGLWKAAWAVDDR